MPPEQPETILTAQDLQRLDASRIQRLNSAYPKLLSGVTVVLLNQPERSLILVCDGQKKAAELQRRSIDLRLSAWFICAAESISIYAKDKLIAIQSAAAAIIKELGYTFEICSSKEHLDMVAEAPAKPRRSRNQTSSTRSNTSTRKTRSNSANKIGNVAADLSNMIGTLSKKTNETIETIALGILNSLPEDTRRTAIEAWADNFLKDDFEQYRASRRNEVFGLLTGGSAASSATAPTNGATATAPKTERQPKQERQLRAATTLRFKTFSAGKSAEKSISNFLNAQGYDAARRIEVIEAIAALSLETPEQSVESFEEQAIKRILKSYPRGRQPSRKAIIQAAQRMKGGEPATNGTETSD